MSPDRLAPMSALPPGLPGRAAGPPIAAHEPRLVRVAALVADASRARMLCLLLSGDCASAGELARAASVSPATASGHLARLVDAGLVVVQARGRHRYFRLADADVARALEALALVAERDSHDRAWEAPSRARLREARCCYGHLAGRCGVALLQGLVERGWLHARHDGREAGFVLTPAGAEGLQALGFDGTGWHARMTAGGSSARRLAHPCLDWSERRDHLAGPLATALLGHFLARGWMRREPGERALQPTPPGRLALGGLLWPAEDTGRTTA